LYEVRVKNWWCIYSGTTYVGRGIRFETGAVPTNIYVNKYLYPFGPSLIRLMPGSEGERDAAGKLKYIDFAMMINISDNISDYTIDGVAKKASPVSILPYAKLDIAAVAENDPEYDPEYPNIAIDADDDGYYIYRTILLHYRFTGSDGKACRVKEEVRLQYIPDVKDPRFLK